MQISNEDYRQYQPLLFSIAYRMLGSIADAEDIVQETFLKAYQFNEDKIRNKKSYLCKIVTNRCLDQLKSSRYKREQYIGPWNPEPLLLEESEQHQPATIVLKKEGLSIAFLKMMEHLSPDERAVLLLKEVFDFTYVEISNFIDKTEENCRKILSRAKQKISRVENESLNYEENKAIIDRFIRAFQTENTAVLLKILSENITLFSDGGGKVNAATRPIESTKNVLALLYGIIKKVPSDFNYEVKNVNHQPAVIIYMYGNIQSVLSFYIEDEQISEMYLTLNPDKLPIR